MHGESSAHQMEHTHIKTGETKNGETKMGQQLGALDILV